MEIEFQQQKVSKSRKTKARSKNKYIGVRQRPSGRWVAEIKDTTQKIRMWLGTFESAEEAAHAYDEAACLLRGSNTRTNFLTNQVSSNSPLASRITTLLNANKINKNAGTKNRNNNAEPKQQKQQQQQQRQESWSSSDSNSSSKCTSSDHDSQLYDDGDDVYKPEVEWGVDEFSFAQEMLDLPNSNLNLESSESEMLEFERIKVERQISASLYAINGLQEYMDTLLDPTDTFWDLPPLSPLPC